MTTIPDLQLSDELQELYLENKEWHSKLLFLEDEYRFFHQLFQNRYALITTNHPEEEASFVRLSLTTLRKQIDALRDLITRHQNLLETILKGDQHHIGMELIEETSAISTAITPL